MSVWSPDNTVDFYARFTVNGLVVYDQTSPPREVYVIVNGATGDFAINGNPTGCTLNFV